MLRYEANGPVDEQKLDALFSAAWPTYTSQDLSELLEASLIHVLAHSDEALVGFVRVLQCGRVRGFVIGPTVHPDAQGQGVGLGLLDAAAVAAKEAGLSQLHVEFASELRGFYGRAGYRHTAAGVRRL